MCALFLDLSLVCASSSEVVVFGPFLQLIFNLCPKIPKVEINRILKIHVLVGGHTNYSFQTILILNHVLGISLFFFPSLG